MIDRIEFLTGDALAAVDKLAKDAGLEVRHVVYDQMRLWCQDVVMLSPPGKKGWKKRQKDRVRADINKVFARLPSPAFRRYVQYLNYSNDGAIMVSTVGRTGKSAKRELRMEQIVSANEMQRLHEQHRRKAGSKSGRVRFKGAKGQAFKGRYVVRQADWRKYVRRRQKSVGLTKAGWLPALEHWARKARTTGKYPNALQSLPRHGTYQGDLKPNGSGTIISLNEVPWMAQRMSQSVFRAAQAKRERDVLHHAQKRLDRLAERFNAGAA